MAVLKMAVGSLALASACYSPSLRDCAVSCETTADCAPSQVCGADHMCASPDLAGRCAGESPELLDAGTDGAVDARMADAGIDAPPPPPDAPLAIVLTVQIMGHGTVVVANVGSCSDTAPGHMCTFAVTAGVPRQAFAQGEDFEKWTSATCMGQDASCVFTPVTSTTVGAKFH